MGNVNNPEALLHGTPDQVADPARYAIQAGIQVIGPECAIPLRTPTANLVAITRAARDVAQPA
jgi:uroporphyrinogen-III decarboxylase